MGTKYTLMHKSIPVMDIEIDSVTGTIIALGDIYDEKRIPIGINILKTGVDRATPAIIVKICSRFK